MLEKDIHDDAFPPAPQPNKNTHDVAYAIVKRTREIIAYINFSGKFPYKSLKGNQYMLIDYHYDANLIWGEAIEKGEAKSITTAWKLL